MTSRITRNDDVGTRREIDIQPQFRLAILFIRAVAEEAILRKDRSDIPVEIDGNIGRVTLERDEKAGKGDDSLLQGHGSPLA